MKGSRRRYGACEDQVLAEIDRKRATLAEVQRMQDVRLALFALEAEGVLRYSQQGR